MPTRDYEKFKAAVLKMTSIDLSAYKEAQMKRRINIGFVIDDIDNYFSNQAAIGAEEAAKALDANLIVFPGHYIGKTDSKQALSGTVL